MKIYMAGPEVFLPDAKAVLWRKSEMVKSFGFQPMAPGDNIVDIVGTPFQRGLTINQFDEELMDQSDAIIANLTPFRGIGADPGTCYELGYMCARGKRVYGYTNDVRSHFARLIDLYDGKIEEAGDGRKYGSDGLALEDLDMPDNLMLVGGIKRRGGTVVVHDAPADIYYSDLTAFEECLRLLKES